jgi:hypothetical protein
MIPSVRDNIFPINHANHPIQLEIGGKVPTWLTTPIITDPIKLLFHYEQDFMSTREVIPAVSSPNRRLRMSRRDASGLSLHGR